MMITAQKRNPIRLLRSHLAIAVVSSACLLVSAAAEDSSAKASSEAAAKAWASVPGLLARIVPPVFPDREFLVTKFGAVGDGAADCTDSIRKAIEACHNAGGGKVVVPPGTFLTGAIHLKSQVNLHLAKGATLRFTTNTAGYLPVVFTRFECTEVMNYSPFIYALGQENIAITGEGTLDGQASKGGWYTWKRNDDIKKLVDMGNQGVPVERRVFGEGHRLRPNFVEPVRCRNVLIEGVRIVDSPMWVLHPLYSTNITIRGVTVECEGPNTDGCDPDSCTDVLIKDCSFSDGDDCIAVKSGRDVDGRRVNMPCQNVVIQNCVFKAGHGGVTMGSETSGGIRNVFAENCRFESPDLDMAMRFKSNPARGGYVENIYLRNCSTKIAKVGIHLTLRYGSSGAREGDTIPIMRNIDIRNSTFETLTQQPVFVEGYSPAIPITDVTIADCVFLKSGAKSFITNANRIILTGTRGAGLE
jgi:polygalacturonase